MNDITAPRKVEIQIKHDEKVIWIHVDGVTVLRCCQIGELVITDERLPISLRGHSPNNVYTWKMPQGRARLNPLNKKEIRCIQKIDPDSGRYVKMNRFTGEIISIKKSIGPYKGIEIQP